LTSSTNLKDEKKKIEETEWSWANAENGEKKKSVEILFLGWKTFAFKD
jgi:hypothetical protein